MAARLALLVALLTVWAAFLNGPSTGAMPLETRVELAVSCCPVKEDVEQEGPRYQARRGIVLAADTSRKRPECWRGLPPTNRRWPYPVTKNLAKLAPCPRPPVRETA